MDCRLLASPVSGLHGNRDLSTTDKMHLLTGLSFKGGRVAKFPGGCGLDQPAGGENVWEGSPVHLQANRNDMREI